MQNDSSVSHIAITCPQCGKHYKKVPYEAIKKYNFAVCKKCNVKFHITAEELEQALQQALDDLQQAARAADGADSQSAAASTGAAQPGSRPYAAGPAGQEPLAEPQGQLPESVAPAPVTPQEEPPGTEEPQPDMAGAPQAPAETVGIDHALEQKITNLAATMEETFRQPPASGAGDGTGGGADELRENAEPPFSINFETEDAARALAARGTDNLQIDNLPDITSPADNSFEPLEEFQAAPPAIAGEDAFDQTFLEDLNLLTTEKQPVEEPALDGVGPDEFSIVYTDEQPAAGELPGQPAPQYPESSAGDEQSADEELLSSILAMDLQSPQEQPAQDAEQDEFISPEVTFSAPGTENLPEESPDDIAIEPETQQALEQDAAAASLEKTALFEELPAADFEEGPADENTVEIPFSADLTAEDLEIPSFDQEPAAEESFSEDALPQGNLTEFGQEAAINESFEEELLDESLIEDAAAPVMEEPFIEEFLDEFPVDEGGGQNNFHPAAGRAGGVSSAPSDASFFDSLQDAEGNRDVSAMLKQLVLPADTIEEGTEQFVIFRLGEQTFAAPIANVFELSLPPELIIVPNTPPWILGVSNMRGEIISVIDFKGFLNIESDSLKKPGRMIIVQTIDKQMVVGLMVDSINGIKYFSVDAIQPLEQQEPGLSDAFFLGACLYESEVVIFLDLEQILQSSKMRQFQ